MEQQLEQLVPAEARGRTVLTLELWASSSVSHLGFGCLWELWRDRQGALSGPQSQSR